MEFTQGVRLRFTKEYTDLHRTNFKYPGDEVVVVERYGSENQFVQIANVVKWKPTTEWALISGYKWTMMPHQLEEFTVVVQEDV
jgi:hypothetical protein